ncbi:MAG: D-alanyl-D-alanine carboxypeptidase/D-alanyl-D-alanine-endopeptidase, partial [Planctomycetota bacterium]
MLRTLRKAVVVLCVPLLLAPAHAASLADAIDAVVRSKAAARARIGVCVAELGSGRERYAHDADRPLRLASNTKLLTVWAALELLGAEHPLRTTLYRRGTLAGQVLLGDLVLEGRGDPTLGQRFDGAPEVAFRRMARAVRQAGIVEVRGDLVLDARYFAPPLQHPDWPRDQLDRWYEAPVSALTLQDGCVDVTVGPGAAAGAPAVVRLVPAGTPLRVENRCTTVGKDGRHVVAVGRKPATDVIVVRGSVRLGSRPRTVSIALRDPAIVVGHVLRRALEAEGVSVGG